MKLRVRYNHEDMVWFGEVQYHDSSAWYRETNYYWTKYGAKRALRRWYKKHITPDKIEEVNTENLIGGRHINALKPLLIYMIVACIMFFICMMCV